jgi:HK97 family phage prohead protease
MSKLERRYFGPEGDLEIRAEEDSRRISGYFAVFNQFSPVYGKFREQIAPEFFDDTMSKSDVRALFNHDESRLLGRSTAGTLRLERDGTGLRGVIDPVPDTPTGNEVLTNLRMRNLTGASFAFSLPPEGGDRWAKGTDGTWERTLVKAAELFDVSVVTNPWYPQTDVGARTEMRSDLERSFERWAAAHPEEMVEPPAEPEPPAEDYELLRMRTRIAGIL